MLNLFVTDIDTSDTFLVVGGLGTMGFPHTRDVLDKVDTENPVRNYDITMTFSDSYAVKSWEGKWFYLHEEPVEHVGAGQWHVERGLLSVPQVKWQCVSVSQTEENTEVIFRTRLHYIIPNIAPER